MSFNPFLETWQLTDDDLLTKINTLAGKISGARRAGMNGNIIFQMEQLYHQLNEEYQRRLTKLNSPKSDDEVIEIGTIEGQEDDIE
jgi:Txe/YoeB family toxin of Txe-Axe toxin-antitoxin module